MVRHIQPLPCLSVADTRGSLHRARKTAVSRRERRLPHLAELVEDIRYDSLIGFIVHEDDGTFACQYQFRKRRPVVDGQGDSRRDVGVSAQTAVFDWSCVVAYIDEVAVADEDGDDIVGVVLDPGGHGAEIGFYGANVEEVAGSVAVVECVVHHVRLTLHYAESQCFSERTCGKERPTHANPIIQLSNDAELLIAGCTARPYEGAVVCPHFRDVAVLSCTELGVVVAWLCVRRLCRAGRATRDVGCSCSIRYGRAAK